MHGDYDNISDSLREVLEGDESVIKATQEMLGDEKQVTLRFGREPMTPKRTESPPRDHRFYDYRIFESYLEQYGGENTVVLADVQAGKFSAVLDDTKKDQFEIVTFTPQVHPALVPWYQLTKGDATSVGRFSDFVMRNRRIVIDPDGKDLAFMFRQVKAAKNVEMNTGIGPNAVNGVICELNIQGTVRKEPVELPETITLHTPIFVDCPAVDIEFDLLVSLEETPRGEKVVVNIGSADMTEKVLIEYETMLVEIETPGLKGRGSIEHGDWGYVRPMK